jgi:hypothetical protein
VVYVSINVDAGAQTTTGAAFEFGGDNTTLRNTSVGNVVDEKAMLSTGANLTIDDVTFHDAVMSAFHDAVMSASGESREVHMDCLHAIGVPGLKSATRRSETTQ